MTYREAQARDRGTASRAWLPRPDAAGVLVSPSNGAAYRVNERGERRRVVPKESAKERKRAQQAARAEAAPPTPIEEDGDAGASPPPLQ